MKRTRLAIALQISAALWISWTATPRGAAAHGLHAHVHATGWAIENLPPGELKSFFADPEVFHAALSGSMFPDTGYALDKPAAREYGEYSHWEPFIERFIQQVRTTYGPTYDTQEERMLVAFLLGCAAHGLEDELFDSTFLFEIEQRDGGGQDIADPAIDGFLILDGFFRLLPRDYFPIDEVLPLYAILNQPIDRALIEDQIRTVRNAYVNDTLGKSFAAAYGTRNRNRIPWASEHYMEMGIAGSIASEVEATARHMQALWDRLHDRFDDRDLVVHAWPDPPRRLRSADHRDVASWITLVLGKGIEEGSASASLIDSMGVPQPFQLRYTRWGGTSRVVRFQPAANLQPGEYYTATLDAGARLVDGSLTTVAHQHTFQVACDDPEDDACPPLAIDDDPIIAGELTATPSSTMTETPAATATRTQSPVPTPTSTQIASATPPPSASATMQSTSTRTPPPLPTQTDIAPLPTATRTNTTATTTATVPATIGGGSVTPTVTPIFIEADGSCAVSPGYGAAWPLAAYLGVALAFRRQRIRARTVR